MRALVLFGGSGVGADGNVVGAGRRMEGRSENTPGVEGGGCGGGGENMELNMLLMPANPPPPSAMGRPSLWLM